MRVRSRPPGHERARELSLLFRGAGKTTAKSLGFAPRLTNLFAKMGELGGYLYDDERDHDYWPALENMRPI